MIAYRPVQRPSTRKQSFHGEDHGYKNYPQGVDLHPDSETHQEILNLVLSYVWSSHDVMQNRYGSWKELDKKLNVYIDLSAEEKADKDDDDRRPVSMVIPISFATRETLMTYRTAALYSGPLFKYDWFDPRDALNVIMLEGLVNQQARRRRMALDMHTWMSDEITYGFSAIDCGWEVERRDMRRRTTDAFGRPLLAPVEEITYEGNCLYPYDPYNTFPDPSVPVHRIEHAQFFAGAERRNYYDLLDLETKNNDIFNVRYLKGIEDGRSWFYNSETESKRMATTKVDSETGIYLASGSRPTDVIRAYCKIIPSEYNLSDWDYPQIWEFWIAADRVIIKAKLREDNHGRIPVATVATNSDDHTVVPTSLLEVNFGMQHAIDWLWSSHVMNVRKHLNNMIVVDPSMVNMNDLVNTKYGMIARLRARAFGKDVKSSIHQLQLTDVTRQNIADIGFLMNIEQRTSAATDQMQGIQNRRGERVSAAEARDTRLSNLSRLQKNVQILSLQGMYPLAMMLASNTAQYLSQETYMKITGEYEQVLREEYGITEQGVRISPEAVNVNFDIIANDGIVQGGEYADTWVQLLQMGGTNPEIAQRIDFARAWLHVARLLGAKNPQDFMKKQQTQQVMPDAAIQRGVAAGNLVTPQEYERATA